ncbi:MAG: TM2 domain-containing protein [Lewinellaceae bacterium]|nr:TM2 domain-containing protein [Lewinellaceae bacterium]
MVDRTGENEIIVAVLLALFLGCLGIHRVYLGGSWLLILAYFFTFGGLFGILPLIDFIRLAAGGIDHYIDNNRFFAAFE